jgi:GntR family transcriptional repressor for pyruvate dehydrogenase complex
MARWITWSEARAYRRLDRANTATEIANRLRSLILRHELADGARLPSQRELARQLGVSLSCVREAMQELTGLGLIEVRLGNGTFVSRRREHRRLLSVALRRAPLAQLARLRGLLEIDAPARAAHRFRRSRGSASGAGEILRHAFDRSMRRAAGPEMFVASDLALHHEIVLASAPQVDLLGGLHARLLTRLQPWLSATAIPLARDEHLDDLHLELARIVVAGDAKRADAIAGQIVSRELGALGLTLP